MIILKQKLNKDGYLSYILNKEELLRKYKNYSIEGAVTCVTQLRPDTFDCVEFEKTIHIKQNSL